MSAAPTVEGLVVVDKRPGRTSHDVVARVRALAGTRRVGHAGTLDPMATGVLVLGVGRATRLLGHLMTTEKAYDATIRLGVRTDSDDAQGEVLERRPAGALEAAAVAAGVADLTGEITQVPSTISAVKVDGQRAYKRARAGEELALAGRRVTVSRFDVRDVRPGEDEGVGVLDVDVSVVCSSGTYVRALARDLGAALGVGGSLTALRRTRVGPYDLAVARTLEQLAEDLTVLPLAAAATAAFPARELTEDQARLVVSGVRVPADGRAQGTYAMLGPDGGLVALAQDRGDVARTLVVFA